LNPRQATLALFSVTIIWGWTFIWLKRAMIVADAHGAGVLGATLFVTLRFALGGALLLACAHAGIEPPPVDRADCESG